MNLYRSLGHIWTGTQADARAANNGDKDFEHIDVPTDKPSLLQFLNEMEARLTPSTAIMGDTHFGIGGDFVEPSDPDAPYRNGDPTTIFAKSRNPQAIFNCTNCGHQNRNQGQ
jgi:hypothetical protein